MIGPARCPHPYAYLLIQRAYNSKTCTNDRSLDEEATSSLVVAEHLFYSRSMPSLSEDNRRAMARALQRAAEHLDDRAKSMDARIAHWRKHRSDDPTATIAATLHEVARDLRTWAQKCLGR